ncbi:cyclodeaminase/cyclohydrolase family protein [Tepidibacter hydrothermalis]|uniref:Cyclodeaminase/cyclohydrolase family protein n=1 Tax=Tepidibacter hydrothermalis TaxID=3036126 RepID=A0ABY8EEK5_9FIRM|nr:cyclodeaminase/cyclohydrolase family protein [Tepidibacter hydrothermalis]WFD11381.1 cyclodeaminase/cyclohydrolase family protein [Tepidibacter hydrothermalis]
MKLIDMKVVDFSNEVDSNSPAPGGGSVAALASNIGISLGRMMGNLSFGKKKFEALDEDIKKEFKEKFEKLGLIRDNLLELVDKDTESFNEVMKAFKLPKETDEQKSIRKKAIQDATIGSIDVPFETAKSSLDALELMEYFVDYGNQNAITDLGVGNLLLYTGLEGAILNVKVNLCGLDDEEFVEKKKSECEDMIVQGSKIKDRVLKRIHEKLI